MDLPLPGNSLDLSGLRHLGIVPLIGHCIATWYDVFRYLVKLTELKTSWVRGDTVTY